MTGLRQGAAFLAAGVVWLAVGLAPAAAQQRRVEQLYTGDGVRLDFPPDGVWRVKARRVAETRARLLRQRDFERLNAPALAGSGLAVPAAMAGTLFMPTILVAFSNTDMGSLPDATDYDSIFYLATPLMGRPYTLRTFYEEMSKVGTGTPLLSVQGRTYGWAAAANDQAYFLDACGAGTDPMGCGTGRARLRELLTGAIAAWDGSVDFGQYDNDGPDGIPNSGDDDGVVDVIQFVQPVIGRECGGPGYGSHKFSLSGLGGAYTTGDARTGGGSITINSYTLVGGVGGTDCATAGAIQGIGTSAHELGHGLGLPDLYDTDPGDSDDSEGIGEWGLMGSGNYTSLISPAHFEAWSKARMGWVVLRELSTNGTYALGPVVSGDTVLLIRPLGSNPRNEYFLLENKQAAGSDTANMLHGSRPKGGGLAVWHVDSIKVAVWPASNTVNTGSPHGVALIQADGLGQLELSTGGNRGDAGDVYPGTSNNTRLSHNTNPAATRNSDGSFAGFEIASIAQNSGIISFQFALGGPTIVRAADTLAKVSVDGIKYNRFAEILTPSSTHTITIDAVQVTTDGLKQFVFEKWSDLGAQTHDITAKLEGDSISADVTTRLRVRATTVGTGTVTAMPAGDLASGIYVRKDSTLKVWATPGSGKVFYGWSGDSATAGDTLVLTVSKPYTLTATFVDPLVAAAGTPPEGVVGQNYSHTLTATGGTGAYSWQLVGGSLPGGLTLSTGGTISGTPTGAGTFNATAQVTSGSQGQTLTVGIVVVPLLAASAGSPPAPIVGKPYTYTLTATGGTGVYSWTISAGSLPPGLALSGEGELVGTPTTAGSYSATARVASGSQTAEVGLSLVAVDQLVVVIGSPPAPVMGKSFSHTLTAAGGTGTATWEIASGALPDGLTLSTAGVISGIPSKTGSFSATVQATSGSQTAQGTVSLNVTAPALATADVVSQILQTRTPLSADDIKYLDLLGNDNGSFDVGDFLAWVNATGPRAPEIAAVIATGIRDRGPGTSRPESRAPDPEPRREKR